MGTFKTDAKQDGATLNGPSCTQKQPAPGVLPGSGDVSSQMNPRRDRRQDYTPSPQKRESGVRI